MKVDVFISYSHSDARYIIDLKKILDEIGIKYFLDQKDIEWGDSFPNEIQKALKECSALVVIVSPASINSSWVLFEIGQATALIGTKLIEQF